MKLSARSETGRIPDPRRDKPLVSHGRSRARCIPLLMAFLAGAAILGRPLPAPAEGIETGRALDRALIPGMLDQAVRPDTILTRADSARLRVLERIRGTSPPPDTVGAEVADTAEAPRDPVGAPLSPGTVVRRSPPPPVLPSGADSVMEALSRLPGYQIAVFQGIRADMEASERRLSLLGTPDERARFSGQGQRVEADSSIVFDDISRRVRTRGATLFTPPDGEPVESRSLIYDLNESRGTALGARTTYTEGATWYVWGDLDSVEQGQLFGSNTRFTSCDHEVPHSFFEARELKVVAGQVLVARGVRMFVEDVPVLWLPFMAQNLGSGRASGLLTPSFSVNDIVRTSDGYDRRISNIGYYWAMSDYSDARIALDWFSNNYRAVTGGIRYTWRRQFLTGNLNLRRYWRDSGGQELAFDTRHNWEISERTRANVSGRYVTSSAFVNRNSFDPREVTQTLNSNAGVSHRFNWGNLSVSANRQQYLNDDRVDLNLPNVRLSLSTMTLFPASPAAASWYNNLSLSGSASLNRDLYDRAVQPDTAFVLSRADEIRTQGSLNASAGLGNFSLGGNVQFSENVFSDVPVSLLPGHGGGTAALVGQMGGFAAGDGLPPAMDPFLRSDLMHDPLDRGEFGRASGSWRANLSYRQDLIGSTTLSPSIGVSADLRRSDSIPEAQSLVSGPVRISVGTRLQTDLYGFYPGVLGFDAVRHKMTPSVTYDFSPQVTPTQLQRDVFGARDSEPRKVLNFGFNQTWEARLPEREEPARPTPAETPVDDPVADTVTDQDVDPPVRADDPDVQDPQVGVPPGGSRGLSDEGLQRTPRSRVVTLLALNTSAVTYDLVEADSTGEFLRGFQTTRLSNTVRSDYLQGLDLSFEHDLFEDIRGDGSGGDEFSRRFAPHLSRMSMGFQVDHRTGIVQWLGGLLGADELPPAPADPDAEVEPEGPREVMGIRLDEGYDPNRVMPGGAGEMEPRVRQEGWSARVSYSLRRPRETEGVTTAQTRAQMLQWTLRFAPTYHWDASWTTSYDIEANRFNDHSVRLTRDLHEWEAIFGFRQTATGNWSFQFEVSLRANRELRFEHEQRSSLRGGADGVPF